MYDATLIYPHQLFKEAPAVAAGRRLYLVEEPLLLTHNPIHRQKLIFHKLSFDAYECELKKNGHEVVRLKIADHTKTTDVFARLRADQIETIHVVDTIDTYLERALANSGLTRVWYDSPLFLVPKDEAVERYHDSKRAMATFYKRLRIDRGILVDEGEKPTGGQWSFDEANRKKLPKDITLPDDIRHFSNTEIKDASAWAKTVPAEQYGEAACWLPYTKTGAQEFLTEFLRTRFHDFGPYEDAITTEHTRLFHSTLSPLLNVGLLTPQQVLDAALAHAADHEVPINSLEGFVRQILGWREFIRASYEADGSAMRSQNFFNHTHPLPASFWDGTTGLQPLDDTISRALTHGYTHHIERLMVMGNFMLLTQTNPDDVYRWFMGMYLDAYDWVMVPNVYGMSQFADGGSFATKPYISGANYIKKMSDLPGGDWEDIWTALYWYFIATHIEFFKSNHRLSMMARLWEKMSDDKQRSYQDTAKSFLQSLR